MRVLMVSSNGGHFWQLASAWECVRQDDVRLVSFKTPDVESWVAAHGVPIDWGYHPTNRNLRNLFRNALLARRILKEFSPDLIITTGAGIAVPFIILGKLLFRTQTMFIEVFDRVTSPTLTGRMVAPFSDWVVLQWEEQRKFYPKGVVLGGLLWSSSRLERTEDPSTVLSTGS